MSICLKHDGGMALAAAVKADAGTPSGGLGLSMALVIILHKPFDALAVSTVMTTSRCSIFSRHLINTLFAFVTPLGAALFYVGVSRYAADTPGVLGGALAFCAGTFLCIAGGGLLPEMQFHSHDRIKLSLALLAGVAVAVLVGLSAHGGSARHEQTIFQPTPPTIPMKNTNTKLNGQRIGLFGRGGCGKSTTTVFLAQALREAGYPVAVLDADSTNEGLAMALGAACAPDDLLEWLGGTVFSGGPVTCPVDDPVPQAGACARLRDLPDRLFVRTPDGILMFQAGKIGPLGPGAGCDGPMTKIARDFTLETDGPAPVMLLDFKAGIEDASRGVITSLDWVVGVIDPTGPGVRAAVTMRTLLEQIHEGGLPATRHLASQDLVKMTEDAYRAARTRGAVFVLNKVPDPDAEHELWQLLVQEGIQPVASFRDEAPLRRAWLEGLPLESAFARSEAEKIVRALEDGRGRFPEKEKP